jgi:hypothetical protein
LLVGAPFLPGEAKMKNRFLNQKLGKRMSHKAEQQRIRLPAQKGAVHRPPEPPRGGRRGG